MENQAGSGSDRVPGGILLGSAVAVAVVLGGKVKLQTVEAVVRGDQEAVEHNSSDILN